VSSPPPWQPLLRGAQPCDHIVQLYTDEAFLTRAVTQFIGTGLLAGEAAAIIATPRHISAFELQLGTMVDVADARVRDQLIVFDAEASLARLMVDGQPDREVFRAFVNAILDRAQAAGNGRVRLFGEMVNLLCDRDPEATAHLESLWNEVIAERRVSLLCAYRLDNFDRHVHRGLLHQISRSHSHVVPVEHYHRLESAVDRAYREIFGAEGDTASLRDLLVAGSAPSPIMPSAQAALIALRGLRTDIADAVLERARHYYTAPIDLGPSSLKA
jgi:hypothetical protein